MALGTNYPYLDLHITDPSSLTTIVTILFVFSLLVCMTKLNPFIMAFYSELISRIISYQIISRGP